MCSIDNLKNTHPVFSSSQLTILVPAILSCNTILDVQSASHAPEHYMCCNQCCCLLRFTTLITILIIILITSLVTAIIHYTLRNAIIKLYQVSTTLLMHKQHFVCNIFIIIMIVTNITTLINMLTC